MTMKLPDDYMKKLADATQHWAESITPQYQRLFQTEHTPGLKPDTVNMTLAKAIKNKCKHVITPYDLWRSV